MEFLVAVHNEDDSWYLDGVIAKDAEDAVAKAHKHRKNAVDAIAFPLSYAQTTIRDLTVLARALRARPA